MPLLFYLPIIVWAGMVAAVQEDLRAPVRIKAQE